MSSFISAVFGKPATQVTFKDVEEFFRSPQKETSVLEFKGGRADVSKVYKEVVAFLNTNGGLVIYGGPEDNNHISVGPLELANVKGGKEALMQKLGSNIVPSPVGIEIMEFVGEHGSVYLIDVMPSSNPPHQDDFDQIYYIRVGTESKRAPHGLVEAMFNRRKLPELLSEVTYMDHANMVVDFDVRVYNNSIIPARRARYTVMIFANATAIRPDERFMSAVAFNSHTTTIRSFSTAGKIRGAMPRGIDGGESFRLTLERSARYVMIAVAAWSEQNDMKYVFRTYDAYTKRIIDTVIDNGAQKVDVILEAFYKLEINRPDIDLLRRE